MWYLRPAAGAEQGVLSAVEQVIGKMKNHETARIMVKPAYGLGEEGNTKHSIPSDADLVYEVRINNFTKVCSFGTSVSGNLMSIFGNFSLSLSVSLSLSLSLPFPSLSFVF